MIAAIAALPDPRRYPARGAPDRLLELVRAALATGDPIARSVHKDVLLGELHARHAAGDDASIAAALAAATAAQEYAFLAQRAAEATEPPLAAGEIGARMFALPLVVVAGGRAGAQLSGALPQVDAVHALLAGHQALGDAQRFTLGNALCAAERLDAVAPGALARAQAAGADALAPLAATFEPDAIVLPAADESVHLRFLVGVAWLTSEARRWIGAGDAVGRWATPLTHLLAGQLAQQDVTVLPLARAPLPLALAAAAGRLAQRELALQMFVGGALRRARASFGEPTAIIAAHRADDPEHAGANAELRITFSSAFDDALCDSYRWPLAPGDDLQAIGTAIVELLRECRLDDVVVVPQVQPDRDPRRPQERLLLTVAHLAQSDPAGASRH
jgi:hypothetical protein